MPRLRRAGAHGQRAGHAPHPVPAHGRAPLRLSAEPAARPPPSEEDENDSSSSSISEYLTKTLPGWHVEDFLVDETAAAATTIGVSTDVSYQAGGLARTGDGYYSAWMAPEQIFCEGKGSRMPQMAMCSSSKRPRATSSYSYW